MIKLIGIKLPKAGSYFNTSYDQSPLVINDENDIKSAIISSLHTNGNDCVLLNFGGKLFVCEKLENTYTRREVFYHPLQSLVS
jgi:hypothetical protein